MTVQANPGGPYPYPYPYYGWHRPWGFGFLFIPLFFAFWFFVVRGLFWRRGRYYGGGCGPRGRFDEWHRQAHARDEGGAGAAGPRGAVSTILVVDDEPEVTVSLPR